MIMRFRSSIIFAALVIACLVASPLNAEQPLTFEQHVRPILKAYCLDCHGAGEKVKGWLDLRLKRFAEKGLSKDVSTIVLN